MLKADILHDEIMELCQSIQEVTLDNRDQVETFVRNFTKLTYDHCMFGLMHDHYLYDCEVLRENCRRLGGVEEIIADRQALLAAYPDLKTKVEQVIVAPDGKGGYKIFRRMYFTGTNTGPSKAGAATGEELENSLALTMFYLSKIDGQWRITYEMDMRSTR